MNNDAETKFELANDAFAYAATLEDGVVLDWGRCYAVVERASLRVGFVIEPQKQPIVTPEDLKVKAGPCFILVRRDVGRGGSSSTCFSNPSESYTEGEVEVLDDGTGRYNKGQRLWVHVRGENVWGSRVSVGQNWRMKLITIEDVQAVLP